MAFRASSVIPASAYDDVRRVAAGIKSDATAAINQMAAGDVPYSFVVTVCLALKNADANLLNFAGTPGIVEYAQAQEGDPAYDIEAEFTALRTAINAALTWLDANMPRSVTVSDPLSWTGPDVINVSFAPTMTATFRTVLQGVVDAIQ